MKTKMTINFEGMQYVRDHYTDSKLTDTLFAAKMHTELGHPYTVAKVRAYRFGLKIPNNVETQPTLKAELEIAKGLLRQCQEKFDMQEEEQRRLSFEVLEFLGD